VRRISTTFGRIYLGVKTNQFIAKRLGPPDMKQRWSRFNRRSAWSIYDSAIELRGMILKACQFIGSRADVMPPEYVEILSELQDRVPPRPFHVVEELVEAELGGPLDRIFASFGEQPIAAASLAQVHEARLLDGTCVAVKVQYPEIEALVHSDVANLRALFRAIGVVERDFDLMPLIDELAEHLPRELDFVSEAHNSERIAKFLERRDDIYIPAVHWDHTTARVLVTDFVDAIKITDLEGLQRAGIEPEKVMRSVIEAYCEQILVHGFFHADPHPGNLMVLPPPADATDASPRIVFVDFGLAKQLPPAFRESTVSFAAALLTGRPDEMAQALVDLGFETRHESLAALREISVVILDVAKRLRRQSFVDPDVVRDATRELPRLIRDNPIVSVPSHLVLVGRVIGLLSGLGSTLQVRVDMLRIILPYVMGQTPPGERPGTH
jgi:predicted unusual protein kinase regulating ubiquinone biosynthesis (AarF/ABC1/UbiB family)